MRKHTTTTTHAQQLYAEIDAILGDIEEFQVRRTLAYLQARCIILHYTDGPRAPIDLWSSAKLPLEVRRTVRTHREEIAAMMHEGDSSVCPTPLHKRYHRRGVCQACKQLEPALEQVSASELIQTL